jgi:stage II sporulation protein D
MHPEEKFHFLFSPGDIPAAQCYPVFDFLAIFPSMKKPLNRLILLLIILATNCKLQATSYSAQAPEGIRVAIIQDAATLRLKIRGPYRVINCSTGAIECYGTDVVTTVTAYKDAILIAGERIRTACLLIKTGQPTPILIDGRMFRGAIKLIRKDNGHLLVINQIDVEDYVKGILYHEVSHYWPEQALNAQAIVCRTYALYQMQANKSRDYDVTADIYSQVYGGRTSERFRTNKAVDDTRGQIITYQGKLIPAYFHATCGGHTEDASLLWDVALPPLKGVACNFCYDSPHFKWHAVIPLDEIEDALTKAGHTIRGIRRIAIAGTDASGRITDINIISDNKTIKIPGKDFRSILGGNDIRSTDFQVTIADSDAVFEGSGWGHGVGLCQWGAYFMAKQGATSKEIIQYYYPGVEITATGSF